MCHFNWVTACGKVWSFSGDLAAAHRTLGNCRYWSLLPSAPAFTIAAATAAAEWRSLNFESSYRLGLRRQALRRSRRSQHGAGGSAGETLPCAGSFISGVISIGAPVSRRDHTRRVGHGARQSSSPCDSRHVVVILGQLQWLIDVSKIRDYRSSFRIGKSCMFVAGA